MEQEANIVTTTVWKPYKLIAYILLLIGLFLFIAVNASTYWIYSESGFRQGLWKECYNSSRVVPTAGVPIVGKIVTTPSTPNKEMSCYKAVRQPWLSACQALSIISLLIMIAGAVCVTISWFSGDHFKGRLTTGGGYLVIGSGIILFLVLVIFPVSIVNADVYIYRKEWEFNWGYGLGWGVLLFQVAIGLLLLLAPETKEIYFNEREV